MTDACHLTALQELKPRLHETTSEPDRHPVTYLNFY